MQFGLAESIVHWARYRPKAPAICAASEVTTYQQFNELSLSLATSIEESCECQSRIAVAVRQKTHLLAAITAVLRTGKSAVILNPGLPENFLQINIADTVSKALVHDIGYIHLGSIFPKGTSLINVQECIRNLETHAQQYIYSFVGRDPIDEWGVLFSSGTTGIPKGIERDHESIVTELIGWCLELGLTRDSSFYVGRPLFYTGGLVLALSTLLVGGKVVLDDVVDEANFDETWLCYQAAATRQTLDYAFFIPDQLRHFCDLAKKSPPLGGARTIVVMGAPITGDEKVLVSKELQCRVIESWGNSESLGTITEAEDLSRRPNSIGRPFLCDRLIVVGDDCKEVPPGTIGRIAGGEEAGFARYSNRPRETERIKRNSLIVSEDLGYQDEDGYFYIRGRDQDIVMLSGVSVFLNEVERGLCAAGVARECCVIALDIPGHDVRFGAMIVLSASTSPEAATTVFRDLLPSLDVQSIVVVVDQLPRLPSGKVDRERVRIMFQGHP